MAGPLVLFQEKRKKSSPSAKSLQESKAKEGRPLTGQPPF
jgi:hypothetical protein